MDRLGDDLAAVLAQLDIRDAVLAGHSMGGFAVMAYATGHAEDASDRMSALALVATATHVPMSPAFEGAVGGVICGRAAEWVVGRPRIGVFAVRQVVGRRPRHRHLDLTRQLFHATSPDVCRDCLRAMSRADLRAGLGKLAVPTVVLVGRLDMLTPLWGARQIARSIPEARLQVLPDAGHMLPLEAPDTVAEAILQVAARR